MDGWMDNSNFDSARGKVKVKVKLSLQQAVQVYGVVRCREFHIV
jgi:hypothetical protein